MSEAANPASARTAPTQSMAASDATTIEVRGYDLCRDIIGKHSFVELFYLELVGRWPSDEEATLLDAALVILTEHGLTPSTIAARMTIHGAPDSVQGAIAAGVLGAGARYLGALDHCAEMLEAMDRGIVTVTEGVADILKRSGRVPGLGHPIHTDTDPRSAALIGLAHERGVVPRYWEIMQDVQRETVARVGRPLPINAEGALSSTLLQIGIPLASIRGVAAVARAAGTLGHITDELRRPTGDHIWKVVDEAIRYEPPPAT